jgi:hypothetical protein
MEAGSSQICDRLGFLASLSRAVGLPPAAGSAINRRMSRRGRDFSDLERDIAAVAETCFRKALTGVSSPIGF